MPEKWMNEMKKQQSVLEITVKLLRKCWQIINNMNLIMRSKISLNFFSSQEKEPPHVKTNNVVVHPAKTLLSAWRKLGSLATHWAHREDSDQTGQKPRHPPSLIWVFAGRIYHFVGFVMRRLKYMYIHGNVNCLKYLALSFRHVTNICIQSYLHILQMYMLRF